MGLLVHSSTALCLGASKIELSSGNRTLLESISVSQEDCLELAKNYYYHHDIIVIVFVSAIGFTYVHLRSNTIQKKSLAVHDC